MRNRPVGVYGVTGEATAQLIENTAFAHALERETGDVACRALDLCAAVFHTSAQAKVDHLRMRKFWCRTEAATFRVERARHLLVARIDWLSRKLTRRHIGRDPVERGNQLLVLRADFALMVAKILRHAAQQIAEAWQTVTRRFRKISATKKRFGFRREKHGQRPATGALCQHRMRGLINLVNIGPLFAIHFNVDKFFVHDCRDAVIFKRLVRHHVTPVTRRIAYREQDRLTGFAGHLQRLRPPFLPMNGILGMLLQVR